MSISYPSSQYKAAGRRYEFWAKMFIEGRKDETAFVFDQSDIISFQYVNRLGELCISGEMEYIDKTGMLINFIHQQYVGLEVSHVPLIEKFDGSFAVQTPSTIEAFNHMFCVTGIQILDRDKSDIRYRIMFISSNWFDCVKTVDYTNYGKKETQVFDIIRTCMQYADLPIDEDSFDLVQSAVKLNYVTNGNDNMFTIVKYLMNKTYYYGDRDGTMRFLCYDDIYRKYGIFDMARPRGWKLDGNRVTVSMDKSQFEELTSKDQAQLASVVQIPKTNVFKSLFSRKVTSFDYDSNEFSAIQIDTDDIADLYNSHGGNSKFYDKMRGLLDGNNEYVARSSGWNSTTDIYGEQLRNMFDDNALVVNTIGCTTRQPGDTIEILVSKDRSDVKTDGIRSFKDWEARYRELAGPWIIAQVRHMICPMPEGASYMQNLTLFKNFIDKK